MSSHDELLQHDAFLRRLTRGLVRGDDRAEDLAQETWVRALGRRAHGGDGAGVRGFLARVARNLAINGAHRDEARAARERAAAHGASERSPSDPSEVAQRLALQRRVVAAVEELPEPYRTSIFLRYFEGLTPSAIAERTDTPLGTVKTRLKRALEQLRARLDRESGGRRAWGLVLAGAFLDSPRALPVATWTGAGAMATKTLAAAGVAIAAIAAAAWWWSDDEPATRAATIAPTTASVGDEAQALAGERVELVAEDAAVTTAREALPLGEDVAPPRTPAPDVAPDRAARAAAQEPAPEPPPLVLRGRVVHAQGPSAAHATVVLGEARALTNMRGEFALALDVAAGRGRGSALDPDAALVAVKEGWSPAVLPEFGRRARQVAESGERIELVLPGEAGQIRGVVLDADGAPGAGWRVKVVDGTVIAEGDFFPLTAEEVAADPSGAYVLNHNHAQSAPPSAWRRGYHETLPDGTFALAGLQLERTYRLRAWNARTLQVIESEPIPTGTDGVVLQASVDPPRPRVDGVVRGTDGAPLEGVRCRLTLIEHRTESSTWMTSGQTVFTDAEGRFEFVDVPHTELFIRFNGHDGDTAVDLEPGRAYRDLQVVIERPGSFTFTALDPERAPEQLAVLDADGRRMKLRFSPEPGRTVTTRELPVSGGRAPEAWVLETARWLVWLVNGAEVDRRVLRIVPGERLDVRE